MSDFLLRINCSSANEAAATESPGARTSGNPACSSTSVPTFFEARGARVPVQGQRICVDLRDL